MRLKEVPWSGGINQDLAGFYSITQAFYRSLRNLVEMIFLSMFITKKMAPIDPAELKGFSIK